MKRKTNCSVTFKKDISGKIQAKQHGSLWQAFHAAHEVVVAHCEYCGKPLSRSDVNDYGSLCERCYIREYYK